MQSIFEIQYYRNEGDYFTIPMHTDFSARPTRFNNNSQPQSQPKIIPEPQLNLDYYHHNYDDEWKGPPRFFYNQPQSHVTYFSFDNKRPFVRSNRMPLALMSTKELA